MEETRAYWRTRILREAAGLGGLLIGIAVLYASEWGHYQMKLAVDAPDVVIGSDAPIVLGALAAACLTAALIGRCSGLSWYWTAIAVPALLCGFVLGYGFSHGVLDTSWEALQSMQSLTYGKHAALAVLIIAAAAISWIATLQTWSVPQRKRVILLVQILLTMVIFALFVEVTYVQMKSELEYTAQLTRDLTAAPPPGTATKSDHIMPKGFILSKP